MKTKLIIVFLVVVIFGCSKPAQNEAEPDTVEESEIVFENANPESLGVLVLDGSLQELRADGRMYWKASIYAGDTVGWTGEKIDAVLDYNRETRTFWRVRADGDYYIQQYYVAGPGYPAVIIKEDTVLYTKPDPGGVARAGKITLSKFELVAMLEDDNPADDFIPVAPFLGLAAPEKRWINRNDLSWDPNDINGVKLVRAAAVTKNAAAHNELLKNALQITGNGIMLGGVPASVNYDPALFELTVMNNLEILEYIEEYSTTEDSVNVRDLPTINSNVVKKLEKNESVVIAAKSKTAETIKVGEEEISGVWLQTNDGHWIFSHYVARL